MIKLRKIVYTSILVALIFGYTLPLMVQATELRAGVPAISTQGEDEPVDNVDSITPEFPAEATLEDISKISKDESAVDERGIIGNDGQIQVLDTTEKPYRQIVRLFMYYGDGVAVGSGTMIGPDTVLTAAHNVYIRGKWVDKVIVAPAMNGSGNYLYGAYVSRHYYMLKNYRNINSYTSSDYDTAVIKLPSAVDKSIDYLHVSDNLSVGQHIQAVGYPSSTKRKSGYMYYMNGVVDGITDNTFNYTIDTEKGQSGGPILNDKNEVVGIHVAAIPGINNYVRNEARRIKNDTLNMIRVAENGEAPTDETDSNIKQYPREKLAPLGLTVHHVVIDEANGDKIIENLRNESYTVHPGWSIRVNVVQQEGVQFLRGENRVWYEEVAKFPNKELTLYYSRTGTQQNPDPKTPPIVTSIAPTTTTKKEVKMTTMMLTTNTSSTKKTTTTVITSSSKPFTTKASSQITVKPTTTVRTTSSSNPTTTKSTSTATTKPSTRTTRKPTTSVSVTNKLTTTSKVKPMSQSTTAKPKGETTTKIITRPTTKAATRVIPKTVSQLKEVHRLYHSGLKVHLYTTNRHERDVLKTRGWKYEGVSWKTETKKGKPVYRLYHSGLKIHLYTRDDNEYKVLATRGWRQEGVAYRSHGSVPIYRLYHSGLKKHLYTRDNNERRVLSKRGWKYEGIAWDSQP